MIRFLGRRFAPDRAAFDAAIAPKGRVYAIGDLHGCSALLGSMLQRIDADLEDCDGPVTLVFMGDYVDRGEDSRGVLDLLQAISERAAFPTVFLLGNHEEMLLEYLEEPAKESRWLRYGGLQTLMSYGVSNVGPPEQVRDRLAAAMGSHIDFLQGLELMHRSGNVLFVHAGADPSLSVTAQSREALLWGDPGFLKVPRRDGVWVVHGHTVVETPQATAGRVAVDTGAYFSGRLTAARIENGNVEFLQA